MTYLPAFKTGEVLVTALESLLSAASLHLGDAAADGGRLEHPDPQEAWLALMAAGALVEKLGPLMAPGIREAYQASLLGLLGRFAKLHPDLPVPTP